MTQAPASVATPPTVSTRPPNRHDIAFARFDAFVLNIVLCQLLMVYCHFRSVDTLVEGVYLLLCSIPLVVIRCILLCRSARSAETGDIATASQGFIVSNAALFFLLMGVPFLYLALSMPVLFVLIVLLDLK